MNKITNNISIGSGRHGFNVEGAAHMEGNVAINSRGDGFHISAVPDVASFLRHLGLPADVDAAALATLLRQLQATSPSMREDTVRKSGFFETALSGLTEVSTVVANIVSIASADLGFAFVKGVLGN